MRKSAAPSLSKKQKFSHGRFSIPVKAPSLSSLHQLDPPRDANISKDHASDTIRVESVQPTEGVINNVNHSCLRRTEPSLSTCFVSPSTAPTSGPYSHEKSHTQSPVTIAQTQYFSVMWCKASKKKHKIWEGDAVLVTHGRSVVLYDMENKEIGRSSGYKIADLENLKEDETLIIGGKEIQVMDRISEINYKSGACFVGSLTDEKENTSLPSKASTLPISKPRKKFAHVLLNGKETVSTSMPCPLYDATRQNALVLPRPTQAHQWQNNKHGLPVVDVVVDPHIANHLRPHQKDGIVFLYECLMNMRDYQGSGAILADEMGLGKTVQTIATIWTLLKQGPYGGRPILKKVLIVTPSSLVKNWLKEFKQWLGDERLPVFAIGQTTPVQDFIHSARWPVLIVSYEMFVRCYDTLCKVHFDAIICDEGHRLKNAQIKTTTMLMSLKCQRRLVLTGTPIQNDLHEFFSLIDFVNPGILGTCTTFKKVFSDPLIASRQPDASTNILEIGECRQSELMRLTKLFILRRTAEVNNMYLPPKREIVVFCKPSSLQITLYSHLLSNKIVRSCITGEDDGAQHLVCISALKKLCNHPSLLHGDSLKAEESKIGSDSVSTNILENLHPLYPPSFTMSQHATEWSGKLTVLSLLLRALDSIHEKVVLVSNHTKMLDVLEKLCISQGYERLRLDGSTPTAKRLDIVQQFNSKYSPIFVLLLSSKAGGVGLNLIGASRLILYDIDWNPANDLQAMARVWRDGQKRIVHVYRLITTGSIEEKIYQRQVNKQGISGAVIDVKTALETRFSREQLKDLFTFNMNTMCDTHDLLKCDCHEKRPNQPIVVEEDIRPCQLGGQPVRKKTQNATMDELYEWQHTSSVSQIPQDFMLTCSEISYMFWNETQA